MNLKLDYTGFENCLIECKECLGGIRYRFKFDNKYGASVIKHCSSYGHDQDLWELAVMYFYDDGPHLTYDTEITDDVVGYLTDEQVRKLLQRIKEL